MWRRITAAPVLLFAAPLLGIWSFRAVGHTVKRIREVRRRRLPINRLLRTLRRLRRRLTDLDSETGGAELVTWGRRFYIDLTDAVRQYLGRRLDLQVYTATTSELRLMLLDEATPAAPGRRLLSILGRADVVKFGGAPLDSGEAAVALDSVQAVAMQYEEALGAQS